MTLTDDQLINGLSLRAWLDEQKARQICKKVGLEFEQVAQAVHEGNVLLDVEANGNNSALKRQLDARAQMLLDVARNENAALKMALRLAGKLNSITA
jgi:hypothetical protein